MNGGLKLRVIAKIRNGFPTKFGVPRQSGLAPSLKAKIVFEKEFFSPEALCGLENFSHIWIVWGFSEAKRENWSPTVRPPRLGGNKKVGVFATRSPFRPNPIGLSLVKIDKVESGEIFFSGADMMDGTPVYDIKPYLPETESISSADNGFCGKVVKKTLEVRFRSEITGEIPEDKIDVLKEILALDPRPAYQNDPDRIYGFLFSGYEVKFRVAENVLTVVSFQELE